MRSETQIFFDALIKVAGYTHTATHTRPNGSKVNVHKLWKLVKTRKPTKVNLDELHPPLSRRSGFSQKRLKNTDTAYPILLGPKEDPYVDGRHRILKLKAQGKKTIMAHRLSKQDLDSAQ